MYFVSIVSLVFVLLFAALTGCQSGSASTSRNVSAVSFADGRTATILVKGMTCPFCASNLETYMAKIDGIELVDADLATGRVLVQLAQVKPDTERVLRKAVDDSGFTVDTIELPSGP